MNVRLLGLIVYIVFWGLSLIAQSNYHESWSVQPYAIRQEAIDVIFVCHPKDTKTLDLAITNIRRYGQDIRRVIVVSPKKLTDLAEWFDEAAFPFTTRSIAQEIFNHQEDKVQAYLNDPKNRIGWIYQQLLKLYAAYTIPYISSNILVVDADTIFLRQTSFMSQQGYALFNPGYEHHQPYFTHAQKLIPGFKKVYARYSGIAHHMLLQRPILDRMFNVIEHTHNTALWKAVCRNINLQEYCPFSEYELYFNFALATCPQAQIRKLKWANILYDTKTITQKQQEDFSYVSCHSFYEQHPHLVSINNVPEMLVAQEGHPEHGIVFIHIGKPLPPYLNDALKQARLFNDCPIYLLAQQEALENWTCQAERISIIRIGSFKPSSEHEDFFKRSNLDRALRNGLFFHASERFFYLADFMRHYRLTNIVHLENDVMLYLDISTILPWLQEHYPGIALIKDNDERAIPSLVYAQDERPLRILCREFLNDINENDMSVLSSLVLKYDRSVANTLPIIPTTYPDQHELKSTRGHTTSQPETYTHYSNELKMLFDGAALGHFLAGVDPQNMHAGPGFINDRSLFNPSHFTYYWKQDEQGRFFPSLTWNDTLYRIVNLHIHAKNLAPFFSLAKEMPHVPV